MTAWWDKKAADLQRRVRQSESEFTGDLDRAEMGRAASYTRQDMVLVVSHLSSLNRQASTIKTLLLAIAAILLVIVFTR